MGTLCRDIRRCSLRVFVRACASDEVDPFPFDQFVGPAQRDRRLREDSPRRCPCSGGAQERRRATVLKFRRERHQGDEQEVVVEGRPFEELFEHLASN